MNSSPLIAVACALLLTVDNGTGQTTNSPPPAPASQAAGVPRKLAERWRGVDTGLHELTPEIVEYLAKLHCNCLRVHVDVDDWDKNKPVQQQVAPTPENPLAPYTENLKILDAILPICRKDGIQIILAVGDLYGRKTDVFWNGTVEGAKVREVLNQCWDALSKRYKDEPAIVGYDVKNEPTDKGGPAGIWWSASLPECIKTIRKNDSTAWIVAEPYMAFATSFEKLPLIDDPRVIYSFHSYWPHGYTHQGVRFLQGRYREDSRGKWTYPGEAPRVETPDLATQKLTYWDKQAVLQTMQPIIDFQKLHPGVRILCGEFGVIRWAPHNAVYLRDMVDILEQYGWDRTFHSIGDWNGWDPTYAADDDVKHNRAKFFDGLKETDRLKILEQAWALNLPNTAKAP